MADNAQEKAASARAAYNDALANAEELREQAEKAEADAAEQAEDAPAE